MESSLLERFIRAYKKSEVIFEQNTLGRDMFVIHSGQVKIAMNENGKEIVLALLGRGEFFGEMALVDDAPRVATAIAEQENTQLIVIDKTKFLYLVNQQPPFALTIMQVLVERIRKLEKELTAK
jgi:CRP/FNR family transcriptional regulator, cyclic AMP receptor protein